jgi:hypothetical protein
MVERTKYSSDDIQQVLTELEASGETVAGFARQRGMPAWRLYEWRRKSQARPPTRSCRGEGLPSLAAVKLRDEPKLAGSFEMKLGAAVVTVPYGFDERELARLLKVVGSC